MRYGEPFTATATSNPERIAELWGRYRPDADDNSSAENGAEMHGKEPDGDAPGTEATSGTEAEEAL